MLLELPNEPDATMPLDLNSDSNKSSSQQRRATEARANRETTRAADSCGSGSSWRSPGNDRNCVTEPSTKYSATAVLSRTDLLLISSLKSSVLKKRSAPEDRSGHSFPTFGSLPGRTQLRAGEAGAVRGGIVYALDKLSRANSGRSPPTPHKTVPNRKSPGNDRFCAPRNQFATIGQGFSHPEVQA
jgi:hypothetical protein